MTTGVATTLLGIALSVLALPAEKRFLMPLALLGILVASTVAATDEGDFGPPFYRVWPAERVRPVGV